MAVSSVVPVPAGHTADSSAESRLKRILESAPASIIVASPEGSVLAANHDALRLLGVGQLDDVLGASLAQWVTSDDRERFQQFVNHVCAGEEGSLEYGIAALDGMLRAVETRAVPLSRDGIVPAAFLSITWDITERKRTASSSLRQAQAKSQLLEVQLVAQREAYERALRDAKAAYETAARDLASERKSAEAEREALKTRLREAEERQASSINAIAEHDARQLATLEALEAQHQQSLAAKAAENERLETALNGLRAQVAQMEEDGAERQRLEAALNEERARYAALVEQQEQWRARLAELLVPAGIQPKTAGVVVPFNAAKSETAGGKSDSEGAGEAAWGRF